MDYAIPEPPCCGSNLLMGPRIKGGEEINKTAGEFPWWVTIDHYYSGVAGSCIGSLLNTQRAITAAHCGSIAKDHKVKVKIDGIEGNGVMVDKVLKIKIADIALLHFVKPVRYDLRNRPLCLPIAPELKERNWNNASVTVVGWEHGKRARRDVHAIQYKKLNIILAPRYTRSGDSGGTMVIQLDNNPRKIKAYYALAIHSGSGGQSIMASIPHHIDWIKDTILSIPYDSP